MIGNSIRVRGVVQGVGFRPFVATIAKQMGLCGEVWNDADGVMIHAWGEPEAMAGFAEKLQENPPPLARIQTVEVSPLRMSCEVEGFRIIVSRDGQTRTGVAADAATCPACLSEVFDSGNRRHRYPFTNCTHCGPRLSIIHQVPYDRKNTSMSSFSMCRLCQSEYDDPENRRFHAQPNACLVCGPKLWLESASGEEASERFEAGDAIEQVAERIRQGEVLAIKGLGGFHLACDALNEAAVSILRQRKQRYHKPFALMGRDVNQIRRYGHISVEEQKALESVEAPVVLLEPMDRGGIAKSVAPGQKSLGFMLPYTPLHHLLMRELDGPIVLTSGNISDEPQCIDNDVAREKLGPLVDGFLMHDRDIVNRLDDSVVRVSGGAVRVLRRARGYAPAPHQLPKGFEKVDGVLAMGGELKNTFCMVSQGQAIVSQHMGDLENGSVLADYSRNLDLYRQIYDFNPQCIAVDMHPNYLSTQWGWKVADDEGCRLFEVQHHHAHVAACMAEHGLVLGEKVLGIALDGLGMGSDGAIWGGEFLLASYKSAKRVGSIQPVAMIGGNKAMVEPWRNSYAHLRISGWHEICERFSDTDIVNMLSNKPLKNIDVMIQKQLNSPEASSAGRLFDAVAATLGICAESVSFEGQAAMALEVAAADAFATEAEQGYSTSITYVDGMPLLGWKEMWLSLLQDIQADVAVEKIAARFHHSLICAIADLATNLAEQHDVMQIVLSGGVFQNRLLFEGVKQRLENTGVVVLAPSQFPANDGGISLGQAVIAAAQSM